MYSSDFKGPASAVRIAHAHASTQCNLSSFADSEGRACRAHRVCRLWTQLYLYGCILESEQYNFYTFLKIKI